MNFSYYETDFRSESVRRKISPLQYTVQSTEVWGGDGRPINQSGVVRPPVSHLIKINAADVPVFRGHRVSAGFSPLPRSPAGNYISNRSVISPPLR